MRLRVIARDIVAIYKGIPALITKALDDWVLEQERRKRRKQAVKDVRAAIDEVIERMRHEANVPKGFLVDPHSSSSELMEQLNEAVLREYRKRVCQHKKKGCGHSE